MKPEGSGGNSTMSQNADMEDLRNVRKSLHVLQPAALDKENLVGPGRSLQTTGKDAKKNRDVEIQNLINEKLNEGKNPKMSKKKRKMVNKMVQTEKPKISVEDLTSEGKASCSNLEACPSEGYWEVLAERRRGALEEALRENSILHEKIEVLEKEKKLTQQLLAEARSMVEVLTEIIEGNDDNPAEP